MRAVLHFGTVGYNFPHWVGVFYPQDMPRRDWLAFYSREFNTCEIASTFQELPPPSAIRALVGKAGTGFLFTVKAHQGMTHQRAGNEGLFTAFRHCLAPLEESGKLGCVVAQFPFSFAWNRDSLDYLQLLRERLGRLPIVVEFRHPSWQQPYVREKLLRFHLAWCYMVSDDPPPTGLEPGPIVYIRLRTSPQGKPYFPSTAWLSWLQSISARAEQTFVFAGSGGDGEAIITMRELKRWLGRDGTAQPQGVELLPTRSGDSGS